MCDSLMLKYNVERSRMVITYLIYKQTRRFLWYIN